MLELIFPIREFKWQKECESAILLGKHKTGKTSLLFQLAKAIVSKNETDEDVYNEVLFITPKELSDMPLEIEDMPLANNSIALSYIKFFFPKSCYEFIQFICNIHSSPSLPKAIIIDNFDQIVHCPGEPNCIGESHSFESFTRDYHQKMAKFTSLVFDSAKFCSERNKNPCSVIVSFNMENHYQNTSPSLNENIDEFQIIAEKYGFLYFKQTWKIDSKEGENYEVTLEDMRRRHTIFFTINYEEKICFRGLSEESLCGDILFG